MQAKRILSLDVGLLIAGAKERGELESRVTNIIREVREAGQLVVHSEMLSDMELLHVVMNIKNHKNFVQAMLFFLLMRSTTLLDLELLERVRVLVLTLATC